jgi:hypothetical protein|nr:MAG TPA: hypothetical protein [Caudoviricetes sp.]
MLTLVNNFAANSEVVVRNIMGLVALLGSIVMILMLIAGTISIMNYGWSSQEASTCGAIALCAGMMVFFACYYVQLH